MNTKNFYWITIAAFVLSCTPKKENPKVKLMTLDPGHFHAALIQKTSYEDIDTTVDVYAPEGPEVEDFLNKIEGYNNRTKNSTNWTVKTHLSEDYLEKMIFRKNGPF